MSVLRLQLKKSLNIRSTRFAKGYNLYDPKYVAWLKVNYPEEDSSHFLSLSECFPDTVTADKLFVIESCSPVSISTQCVDVSSASSCITSTPRTVSSISATVSALGINTHMMSPVEASMESSITCTSVSSSSTQLTPLVGTTVVHTSSTVLNDPNFTVAPNASIQLISPVPVSTSSADSSITFPSTPSTSIQSVSLAMVSIPSFTSSAPSTLVLTLDTGTQ